jgi:tetratricopeptide (TPR) repeat protein
MSALIYFFTLLLIPGQAEYCSNEPIVFTVNINADSAKAEQSVMYEKELLQFQKRTDKINDETYKKSKELLDLKQDFSVKDKRNWKNKVAIEFFNNNEKKWLAYPAPIHLLDNNIESPTLKIEKNGYYIIDLGIDPDDTERLSSGHQKIRARLIVQNNKKRTDTVYSEPVLIDILAKDKPLNDQVLFKNLSIYYSRRGLNEKALEYANLFNEVCTNDYEGTILLGQMYEALGDYDNAIKYYITAKGETDSLSHQSNEYLESKIQEILEISPGSINTMLKSGKE